MRVTLLGITMLVGTCAFLACENEDAAPRECGFAELEEHVVVENRDDEIGPGQAIVRDVIVSRGYRSAFGVSTACDDRGLLSVVLVVPEDDQSAKENLGYRLRETTPLPDGLVLPDIVRAKDGVIDVIWFDGQEQTQEGFEFDLQVAAVDEAGNFGEFSDPFRVSDRGTILGCSATETPSSLIALFLLLFWRNKRTGEFFHANFLRSYKSRLKINN